MFDILLLSVYTTSMEIKEAKQWKSLKNLTLFTIKTIIILLLSMLFVSNLQIQQTDTNGRITQTYNIINCYSVLQAGFYQIGE